MSRFVRPETATLTLANGDTLTVKKRLSAGEHRELLARMSYIAADGTRKFDNLNRGLAMAQSYLIDWSLTDAAGNAVEIRGMSVDALTAALNNLTTEDFNEIRDAIDAHEVATDQERADAKKKTTAGATASDPISPSPSAAAGQLTK